jgi:hypothetical protein
LFPAHEVDEFTALFWERIQRWRADNVPSPAGVPETKPGRGAG